MGVGKKGAKRQTFGAVIGIIAPAIGAVWV